MRALILSVLILVGACSPHPVEHKAEPIEPTPTQEPKKKKRTSLKMSFYRMGTVTASGEPYDPSKLTCAAVSRFDLGTYLHLHKNGRSVRVRLNDRGGFEKMGRSLDCSPAVWAALGIPLDVGVATVSV